MEQPCPGPHGPLPLTCTAWCRSPRYSSTTCSALSKYVRNPRASSSSLSELPRCCSACMTDMQRIHIEVTSL